MFPAATSGESLMIREHDERLGDDVLYGARAISNYTGLTIRQVYHQQNALELTHLGAMLVGSKRKLKKLLTGEAA
jgi:hypothetical protein